MPLPERYRLEQIANRRAGEREANRDTRLGWLRGVAEIIVWTLAGLLCIAMAFHSIDPRMALAYWWLGHVVWIGGVSMSLLSIYRRGRERGDW
jgi:hypothetical protein